MVPTELQVFIGLQAITRSLVIYRLEGLIDWRTSLTPKRAGLLAVAEPIWPKRALREENWKLNPDSFPRGWLTAWTDCSRPSENRHCAAHCRNIIPLALSLWILVPSFRPLFSGFIPGHNNNVFRLVEHYVMFRLVFFIAPYEDYWGNAFS